MENKKNLYEAFKAECKVMNLRTEYGKNYVGRERYAIITDLTEEELTSRFGAIMDRYQPFVVMNAEMEMAKKTFENSDRRYAYMIRHGVTSSEEVVDGEEDTTSEKALSNIQAEMLQEALKQLSPKQEKRLRMYFCENQTLQTVADSEQVTIGSVWCRIQEGISKLREILTNPPYSNYFN